MDEQERAKQVQQTFDLVANSYDNPALSWFDDTALAIAKRAELKAGERVLDLASGTGKVAIALAHSEPLASVIGTDISTGMLAEAKKKAELAGLQNLNFEQHAFEEFSQSSSPYETKFDLLSCSFGLFFVNDMESTFAGFAAQLKNGGRLALSTFKAGAFSPFTDCFLRLYREFGFEVPTPSWFRLASEENLEAMYASAGLERPEISEHEFGFELLSTEQWWTIIWSAGYRGMLMRMSPKQQKDFREQHLSKVQALIDDGKSFLSVPILIAFAKKP